MSLIHSLIEAVRSLRRRRVGSKPQRRASVALERLDHRQLLSVAFTGNVTTDFPTPSGTGFTRLAATVPPDQRPVFTDPAVRDLVKVSGFDVQAIWVSYDPQDDTLNIGFEQPGNQKTTPERPVIAGDADNNLNSATTDPAVQALTSPDFINFPDLQGTQYMAAFLSLANNNVPDVIAGYPQSLDPRPGTKPYEVADAIPGPGGSKPSFGTPLPQNTGTVFLQNDPTTPNLEFVISNFSRLYLAKTGQALNPNSVIQIGAEAGSLNDPTISDTFIRFKSFALGQVTAPRVVCPPCPPPPPKEPPILINPHLHRHINTAHPTDVRVNVLGSAGFDVTRIIPESVRLGGAAPYFSFTRPINRDQYLDRTFVFKGDQISLPPGITDAVVTGSLTDGTTFRSTYQVFNRDASAYTGTAILTQQIRRDPSGPTADLTPLQEQLDRHQVFDAALAQVQQAPGPAQGGAIGPGTARQAAASSDPGRATGPTVRIATTRQRGTDPTAVTVDRGPVVTIPTRSQQPIQPRPLQVVTGPGTSRPDGASLAN